MEIDKKFVPNIVRFAEEKIMKTYGACNFNMYLIGWNDEYLSQR